MAEKRIRRTFSPEFKKQAVEKVLIDGMSVADVARDLDISRVSIDNWIKQARILSTGQGAHKPAQPVAAEEEPIKEEVPETTVQEQPAFVERKEEAPKPAFKVEPLVSNDGNSFKVQERTLFDQPVEKEGAFVKEDPIERLQENVAAAPSQDKGNQNQNQNQQKGDKGFFNKKKNFQNKQNQQNQQNQQKQPPKKNFEPRQPVMEDIEPEEKPEEKIPVPVVRHTNSKWFVEDALDQLPRYKDRNAALGFKDRFQIPARTIEEVWPILQAIQEKDDKNAFNRMVSSEGLSVKDEVLANPRQKNLDNDNRANRKPWQKPTPRMDPVAAEFFKTVPEYAKSVYEFVGPLCLKVAPDSNISPVIVCKGNEETGWDMEVDFSKFDRFVDDYYGSFVNECKTILMQKNPKEYHSLNAFIRYPDHPAWNPKLWAGLRKIRVQPRESFAHAWLRSINEI